MSGASSDDGTEMLVGTPSLPFWRGQFDSRLCRISALVSLEF